MLQPAARKTNSLNLKNVVQKTILQHSGWFWGTLEQLCSIDDGIPVPGNVPCHSDFLILT